MRVSLLIDFGSTYTKMFAVDLDAEELLGRAQSPSTVGTDITIGLDLAYKELLKVLGKKELKTDQKLACSSAAGGLRIVAIGLVPELTTEAAKRAALGAGAKVVGSFSHKLNLRELDKVFDLKPDMILLAGGTDGGNKEVVVHNAKLLCDDHKLTCAVVMAGNKEADDEIECMLKERNKHIVITENVLQELGQLNVEPARSAIRELFMQRITHAKGLDKAQDFVGGILMPTPMAVLNGAKLLADGTQEEEGIGGLMVVDVGGATTDVDTCCTGNPTQPGIIEKGLPEPYAKRTVEGDLGIRYNAHYIFEMAGRKKIMENAGAARRDLLKDVDFEAAANYLSSHIDVVPETEKDTWVDVALSRTAVDMAVERHAGCIQPFYSPSGTVYLQYGKDLMEVKTVIGVGGVFAFGKEQRWVLEGSVFTEKSPASLRPKNPDFYIDKDYLLYGIGLLSKAAPEKALRIMKKHLYKV